MTIPVHKIYKGAALVIGGTGGLGKAVCRGLASDWEAVSFTYRSRREEAQALERELSVHCQAASAFADLRDPSSIAAALRATKERFGSVGTVVLRQA